MKRGFSAQDIMDRLTPRSKRRYSHQLVRSQSFKQPNGEVKSMQSQVTGVLPLSVPEVAHTNSLLTGSQRSDAILEGYNPVYGEETVRGCTDTIILMLFFLFWCGMFMVAAMAFSTGDPNKLLYGLDYEYDLCGNNIAAHPVTVDQDFYNVGEMQWEKETHHYTTAGKDLTDRPFLFFADLSNKKAVCLEKCPEASGTIVDDDLYGLSYLTYSTYTLLHQCVPMPSAQELVELQAYANASVTDVQVITSTLINPGAIMSRGAGDIKTTAPVILGCLLLAIVLGFIWVWLMKLLAGILTVVTLSLVGGLLCFCTYYFHHASLTVHDPNQASLCTFMFYMAGGATAAYVFLLAYMYKRIQIAIGIIKQASSAMLDLPQLICVPAFVSILNLGFLLYWLVVAVYLAGSGTLTAGTSGYGHFEYDRTVENAGWYHIFGLLWTGNAFVHFCSMVVASSVVLWYWAPRSNSGERLVTRHPVLTATAISAQYHLGSISFGALIVAIAQFIRLLFNYAKKYVSGDNKCCGPLIKLLWCCIDCCLKCIEKTLEFVSKSAYIQISIYGCSFCEGAWDAFRLLLENAGRLVAVEVIGKSMLSLGKFVICGTCTLVGVLVMELTPGMRQKISSILLPSMAIFVGSYMIACVMMSMYEMAIDTVLQCFCIDDAKNSEKGNMYADQNLAKYVQSNKEQSSN